jgi:quercetin dioxygenase-like cupin family protein
VTFKNSTFSELQSDTKGKIIIWSLYSDSDIGIVRFMATKGSIHTEHKHDMQEILCISNGKLIAHLPDKDVIVNQYETIVIPAGVPHTMEYPELTMGAAITMPIDLAFQ